MNHDEIEWTPTMTWVRMDLHKMLGGRIRYRLEPDERSVYQDLIYMAGQAGVKGWVSKHPKRQSPPEPYTHEELARELNITVDLLDRTLAKLEVECLASENGRGIFITDWYETQADYYNQKQNYKNWREKTGGAGGRRKGDPERVKQTYGHLVKRGGEDEDEEEG